MKTVLSPEEMGIFFPQDLEEIQRIFQKLCDERGLARGSEGASSLARSILVYYSQGVRDPAALERLLRGPPGKSHRAP
ncbi:hypothetical protein [Mycoplana ramosa]|uniref:Uncharacterized protein n=1 Tax=Mycoplana ramosa TaxID=40837 RepID=A0ABW3YSL7_MYCRA